MLEPEDNTPKHWSPQFVVGASELRHRVESEDTVLVYFWSSAEQHLSRSQSLYLAGVFPYQQAFALLEHFGCPMGRHPTMSTS